MQVDWQAVLQGSQAMQQPKEFQRIAEESVAQKMDTVRQEAASRGWLGNDLPSGMPPGYPSIVKLLRACQQNQDRPHPSAAAVVQMPYRQPSHRKLAQKCAFRCRASDQDRLSEQRVGPTPVLASCQRCLCADAGRNERIFVAGHSAGGQVAEDYALKKTGGLILLVSWPHALPLLVPLVQCAGSSYMATTPP